MRAIKVTSGIVLSAAWVVYGLWLWDNTWPILALGPASAGVFLLMVMVADDLAPRAYPRVTGTLKMAVMLTFFGWAELLLLSALLGLPS